MEHFHIPSSADCTWCNGWQSAPCSWMSLSNFHNHSAVHRMHIWKTWVKLLWFLKMPAGHSFACIAFYRSSTKTKQKHEYTTMLVLYFRPNDQQSGQTRDTYIQHLSAERQTLVVLMCLVGVKEIREYKHEVPYFLQQKAFSIFSNNDPNWPLWHKIDLEIINWKPNIKYLI